MGYGGYIWPSRLFAEISKSRGAFRCPAAPPSSAWDTNVNKTLGVQATQGWPTGPGWDPWGVNPARSYFSFAYNDWGLRAPGQYPQLGLGGNIDNCPSVRGSDVVAPAEMIMLADSRATGFLARIWTQPKTIKVIIRWANNGLLIAITAARTSCSLTVMQRRRFATT